MLDASMIDLWLDVSNQRGAQVVVPYIKVNVQAEASYRVYVLRAGPAGRSEINQSGKVTLQPDIASSLGQVSVNRAPNDNCRVEIRLFEGDLEVTVREFECPPVRLP